MNVSIFRVAGPLATQTFARPSFTSIKAVASCDRTTPVLLDDFHRAHNYLRISLTERCNLRCTLTPTNAFVAEFQLSSSEIQVIIACLKTEWN